MPLYNNPLQVPRVLTESSGRLTTAAVGGTQYLISSSNTDQVATASANAAGGLGTAGFNYTGASYDYPGTTQKIYIEGSVILTGTAPTGTITFSISPFTVSAGNWVPGTAVATTSAISLTGTNTIVSGTSSQVNKPSDGYLVLTCTPNTTPLSNYSLHCRVFVLNI